MLNKIKKLVNQEISSITKAAFLLSIFSFTSRILGMIRDRVLVSQFGAGNTLDVYYASFQVPNFIANLLILGTLSVAFIPVFTHYITKAKEGKSEPSTRAERNKFFSEPWEVTNSILNFSAIAILAIYTVFFFSAPYLIQYVVPGFSQAKRLQALTMTRIMLLSPVFFCLSSVISSVLYSFKCFLAVALSPIFYNLGIIFGALVLSRFFGIYGLAMGVVLGAFMHLLVQLPTVRRLGLIYTPKINLKHKGVREIGRLFLPRIFGIDSSQISLLIGSIIGSTLSKGSISIYNLSNNIQNMPVGLFGVSFAVAAFPVLSEVISEKRNDKFVQCFSETARKVLFLVIPTIILTVVLRREIVSIILGTGKFSSTNIGFTAIALCIFCLSLFSQCLMPLTSRAFYAMHNTIIPVSTSIFCMFVNIGACLLFTKILEDRGISNRILETLHLGNSGDIRVFGLVLAFSISSWINFLILILILRKRMGRLGGILRTSYTFAWSAIIAGIVAQGSLHQLRFSFSGTGFLDNVVCFTIPGILGISVYVAILQKLQNKESGYFVSKLKGRLPKRK